MLSLLSLTSLKEWFWAGLVIAMGLLALHIYHAGEKHEAAALQAQSAKLEQQAWTDIHNQDVAYAKQLQTLKDQLNAERQAAIAQHNADTQRLRDFDAYRRLHPEVAGAPSGPGAGGSGTSGTEGGTDLVSRLEQVASELASAARSTTNALSACIAERNTVKGH